MAQPGWHWHESSCQNPFQARSVTRIRISLGPRTPTVVGRVTTHCRKSQSHCRKIRTSGSGPSLRYYQRRRAISHRRRPQ